MTALVDLRRRADGAAPDVTGRAEPPGGRPSATSALVDPTASRRRRAQRFALPTPLRRLAGPMVLLAGWTALTAFHVVDHQYLSPPADAWHQGAVLWGNGQLVHNLGVSLGRAAWGLGLGVVVGLGLAVLAGTVRIFDDVVDSSMNVLRAIPIIALLPLLIVWVGIGEQARVFLVAVGAAFPIYINTHGAIRGVDTKLVEAAETFGVRRWGVIRKVVIPGALPGFLVGLRWAIGSAWLLLVFAEQVNTSTGLGQLLIQAQSFNKTDEILFILVLYGAIGLLGDGIVRLLESQLLSWRRGFTG